jgi:hypothetical protein
MAQELDDAEYVSILKDRLEAYDPPDSEDADYDDGKTTYDQHFRDRSEPRNPERETSERRNQVYNNWQRQAVKEGQRRGYSPEKPQAMAKDDLRSEIESQIEWRSTPLRDRRNQFMLHHQLDSNAKAARDLGLPEPKTLQEKFELQKLMGEQEAKEKQQQSATPHSDAASSHPDWANNLVGELMPYIEHAQASGTPLPQQLQQWHAAEQYLQTQPVEGLKWMANYYGVSLSALSDPEMSKYDQMARNSGTRLSDAVGRYVAAEAYLERDPVAGILWLCSNYRVSPQQLLNAMNKKRRAA